MRKFVSPGGEFFVSREEERGENFFLPWKQLFQKERKRESVRAQKSYFFSLLSQNVIVRERNDAFLCLSRETVSVWY